MNTTRSLFQTDTPFILPDGHEIKVHGTTNVPYIVYRSIIPDYMPSYPLHYHEETELIYCQSGAGKISIDGTDHIVHSGDLAVILPEQIHAIASVCEPFEYFNILFKFSILEPESENNVIFERYLAPFCSGALTVPSILKRDSSVCKKLSSHIIPLIHAREAISILMIKSHLYAIMDTLNQIAAPPLQKSVSDHKASAFLHNVIQYINLHYSEKISISQISAFCGYSSSHFMKLFRELTGTSFSQYLIHFRLEKAASLLRNTKKSILEIATLCGFSNASYFTRAFFNQYQCVPSDYRLDLTDH